MFKRNLKLILNKFVEFRYERVVGSLESFDAFNLCASAIEIIEAEIVFLWNESNVRVIVNYGSIG